jgi:hypothetical protein
MKWNQGRQIWQFEPNICEICRSTSKHQADISRFEFKNQDVNILCMKSREELDIYLAKQSVASLGEGRLRRTRNNAPKKGNVCLSSEDTIALVKLKIFESFHHFDLSPNCQKLFVESGKELLGNAKMLKDFHIESTSKILVLLDESAGSDDLGWLDGWNDVQSSKVEYGFSGTLFSAKVDNKLESNNITDTNQNYESVVDLCDLSFEEQMKKAIEESKNFCK